MSTTSNIGLEILTEGQANKEASITASHQTLDTLVQAAVIDRDLTTPPSGSPGPAEGAVYLIPTGSPAASGAWAGQDGDIAHYRNSAWEFITPKEGWRLYVKDEDIFIIYDGSNWSTIGGSITVKESDGSPSISEVTTIAVTNGKLTDDGGGQVTLDLSGAGGSSIAGYQGIWEQIDRAEFSAASSVIVGGSQTPGDYDAYILLVTGIDVSADGTSVDIYTSTDGGSSRVTSNTRAGVYRRSNNAGGTFGNEAAGFLVTTGPIDTGIFSRPTTLKVEMMAPGSSDYKTCWAHFTEVDDGSAATLFQQVEAARARTTSTINSFIIEPSSGTITGTAVLLGLKKSEMAGRVVEDTSAGRTLIVNDNNRLIHFTNSGSGVTVTVPGTLPEGFTCRAINETGGTITLSGSGGLTILGDSSVAQNRVAEISRIKNVKASVVAL